MDVKRVLSHFDFHLSAIFITLRPNCDISMQILKKKINNGLFNVFFPLPNTCHFGTRLSPLSIIGENARSAHFLQLCRKNEYGHPIFYFMILISTVLPFNEKKIGINLCSVFWQFY